MAKDDDFKSSVFNDIETLQDCSSEADRYKKTYGESQFKALLTIYDSIFKGGIVSAPFREAFGKSKKFQKKMEETHTPQKLNELRELGFSVGKTAISSKEAEKLKQINNCMNVFRAIAANGEDVPEDIRNDPFGKAVIAEMEKQLTYLDANKLKSASRILEDAFCEELNRYSGFLVGSPTNFEFRALPEILPAKRFWDSPVLRVVYTSLPPVQKKYLDEKYKQGYTFKKIKLNAELDPSKLKLVAPFEGKSWIVELDSHAAQPEGKTTPTLTVLTTMHEAYKHVTAAITQATVSSKRPNTPLSITSDAPGSPILDSDSDISSPISTNSSSRPSLDTQITWPSDIGRNSSDASRSLRSASFPIEDDPKVAKTDARESAFQQALKKRDLLGRFTPSKSPRVVKMGEEGYIEANGNKVYDDKENNTAYVLNWHRQPHEPAKGPTEPVFVQVPSELIRDVDDNQSIRLIKKPGEALQVIVAPKKEKKKDDPAPMLEKPKPTKKKSW